MHVGALSLGTRGGFSFPKIKSAWGAAFFVNKYDSLPPTTIFSPPRRNIFMKIKANISGWILHSPGAKTGLVLKQWISFGSLNLA